MRTRWVRGVGSGLVVLGMAGCAAGENVAAPLSPSISASPRDGRADEREADQAFRGMWREFTVAARTSNAVAPGLATYATGRALQKMTASLRVDSERDVVTTGAPIIVTLTVTPGRSSAAPTTIAITSCIDDSQWLKRTTAGELLNDDRGGRHRTTATVMNVGDWKVDSFIVEKTGSC